MDTFACCAMTIELHDESEYNIRHTPAVEGVESVSSEHDVMRAYVSSAEAHVPGAEEADEQDNDDGEYSVTPPPLVDFVPHAESVKQQSAVTYAEFTVDTANEIKMMTRDIEAVRVNRTFLILNREKLW